MCKGMQFLCYGFCNEMSTTCYRKYYCSIRLKENIRKRIFIAYKKRTCMQYPRTINILKKIYQLFPENL